MNNTEIFELGQTLATLNQTELSFVKGFICGVQSSAYSQDEKTTAPNNQQEKDND